MWYTSIAFGLFGVLCAFFVKEMDHKLTDHIAVDLEKFKKTLKGGRVSAKEEEAVAAEPEEH